MMSQQVLDGVSTETIVPAGVWSVDPDHSRIGFAVRHVGIVTVRGEFTQFEGTLESGGSLSTLRASGNVTTASVFTHQPRRDEHLRSGDFFDVARYPTLEFASTRIDAIDEESFRITGELTMHGVSDEVVLRAAVQGTDVDPFGNERVGLEVTGEISRAAYGISYNVPLGSGQVLIGDRVKLTLDISAIKQS
jgi:polyisoprenoid-binding protein YceI